jgi:hypothetical protein
LNETNLQAHLRIVESITAGAFGGGVAGVAEMNGKLNVGHQAIVDLKKRQFGIRIGEVSMRSNAGVDFVVAVLRRIRIVGVERRPSQSPQGRGGEQADEKNDPFHLKIISR